MHEFIEAMRQQGLEPPDQIEPGKFYRFPGNNKAASNTAGWCKLFPDCAGGSFGDWSTGLNEVWFPANPQQISPQEREARKRQAGLAAREAEEARKLEQAKAAQRAAEIWRDSTPVSSHPYLEQKGVKAHGIRENGGDLIIPLFSDGAIQSIQRIAPDGAKRFLPGGRTKGCYFMLGKPSDPIYVCEGYATAASVHEATKKAAVVAFNAGNLQAVCEALQASYGAKIRIAADNDPVGLEKARATCSDVVEPPEEGDWNDYAQKHGLKALTSLLGGGCLLDQFVLNGKSKEMEEQMLNDVFVLDQIAIQGQSTVIYARPNTGKTLLTLSLICEAVASKTVDGGKVYYVNADDDFKGLHFKLALAERVGFMMMAPGYNGFTARDFLAHIHMLSTEGSPAGTVIVLDTLKKFTDIMDKTAASLFGKTIREFVSKQGTVIMLAHTNKNRDGEGKPIYGGTSDIVDDVDCAYTLDLVSDDGITKTVLFENMKCRGPVSKEVSYTYLSKYKDYGELLDSVKQLDEVSAEKAKALQAINERLDRNRDAIEAITECIKEGITQRTQIIKAATESSGISRRQINRALRDHTGNNYKSGHRWREEKGERNAKSYSLLREFSPADYLEASNGD